MNSGWDSVCCGLGISVKFYVEKQHLCGVIKYQPQLLDELMKNV